MAARRRSRHRAIQILYQCDVRNLPADEAIAAFYDGLYSEENEQRPGKDIFMESLVRGTLANQASLDAHISRSSANWRLERMAAVDRNILRMAIYELIEGKNPPAVIIDEALELGRRFSGEESVAFINGVLDSIRKELAPSFANTEGGKNPV